MQAMGMRFGEKLSGKADDVIIMICAYVIFDTRREPMSYAN